MRKEQQDALWDGLVNSQLLPLHRLLPRLTPPLTGRIRSAPLRRRLRQVLGGRLQTGPPPLCPQLALADTLSRLRTAKRRPLAGSQRGPERAPASLPASRRDRAADGRAADNGWYARTPTACWGKPVDVRSDLLTPFRLGSRRNTHNARRALAAAPSAAISGRQDEQGQSGGARGADTVRRGGGVARCEPGGGGWVGGGGAGSVRRSSRPSGGEGKGTGPRDAAVGMRCVTEGRRISAGLVMTRCWLL